MDAPGVACSFPCLTVSDISALCFPSFWFFPFLHEAQYGTYFETGVERKKKGGEYLDLPPKEQVKSYGFRSTSIIQKSKFALRSAE